MQGVENSMGDYGYDIAERKIREAISRGEFDNLSGKGKKIDLSKWERIPEELRASYTILKNAGYIPEEIEIQKQIFMLEELLRKAGEERKQNDYRDRINRLKTKYMILMEKKGKK